METKKMKELYGKIATQLGDMIPDDWEKIYMYGEVLSDSREVFFYYKSSENSEVLYSHDIPKRYRVDKGIYYKLLLELIGYLVELHQEYEQNFENVWTNLTFVIDNNGHFHIDYNYDDVLKSPFTSGQRQIIWKYEVLGIEPLSDEQQELIRKYLASKS